MSWLLRTAMQRWCSPPITRGAWDSRNGSTATSPSPSSIRATGSVARARRDRHPPAVPLAYSAAVRVRVGDQGAARTSRHRGSARQRGHRGLHVDRIASSRRPGPYLLRGRLLGGAGAPGHGDPGRNCEETLLGFRHAQTAAVSIVRRVRGRLSRTILPKRSSAARARRIRWPSR